MMIFPDWIKLQGILLPDHELGPQFPVIFKLMNSPVRKQNLCGMKYLVLELGFTNMGCPFYLVCFLLNQLIVKPYDMLEGRYGQKE
jgi:hypothetical protein